MCCVDLSCSKHIGTIVVRVAVNQAAERALLPALSGELSTNDDCGHGELRPVLEVMLAAREARSSVRCDFDSPCVPYSDLFCSLINAV